MNNHTPVPNKTDRKRYLSSPSDNTEPKKNRANDEMNSIQEDDSLPRISLSESDLDHICKLVGETCQSKLGDLVSSIVDGVVSGLTAQIDDLKQENAELKDRVAKLEEKADTAEQYSRRNCIRISRLPEEEGECTDVKVVDMATALGVDLSICEIDRSHRLGKVTPNPTEGQVKSKPRDIIVKFATYRSRNKFFERKSNLRKCGYEGIFVSEDLTRERNNIFYEARRLVKLHIAAGTWTSDGTIIVKDNDSKKHRITTMEQLIDLRKRLIV